MKQDPDKSRMNFSNRALKWLAILMALFLLIEIPLLISHDRHAYFKVDGWFGFYAVLGLAASTVLVFLARALSGLIRRDDSENVAGLGKVPTATGRGSAGRNSTESRYGDAQDDEPLPEDIDEQLR